MKLSKSISMREIKRIADQIFKAYRDGEKIPLASMLKPGITPSEAYLVQKEYLHSRLASDEICGFKAGLCTSGAQNKFDYNEPLSGVLYSSGNFSEGKVPCYPSGQMIIETEIGLVPGSDIFSPVSSVKEMKDLIAEVMPAIEFPDHNFADLDNYKVVDLIACNVIASGSLEGIRISSDKFDINNAEVCLYHEGRKIDSGVGSNTWKDDQWESALWLVNRIIEDGYTIRKGHFLLTGAMGSMVLAEKGNYRADYGKLGIIEFEVI